MRWRFRDFKKAIGERRLRRHPTEDDLLCISNLRNTGNGKWWPATGGGLVRLPEDSRKFLFKEWVT